MPRKLSAHLESWRYTAPIRITGHVFEELRVLVVEIKDGEHVGRGEASGVYFLGETVESLLDEVLSAAPMICQGADRAALAERLPAGGARNALDCALWDLECRQSGRTIWALTGITPRPLLTLQTITMQESPEDVAQMARAMTDAPLLKLKLDRDRPVERVEAARAARPDARLIIDANQGFAFSQLKDIAPHLARLGVEMIEQPLGREHDSCLEHYTCPVPLCADESCLDRSSLEAVARRYQAINIKLDKTGGLTEAFALARAARSRGLGLMVGNMSGTSLATAPGYVIGQSCSVVDLDGPLSLVCDRPGGMLFEKSMIMEPVPRFWG